MDGSSNDDDDNDYYYYYINNKNKTKKKKWVFGPCLHVKKFSRNPQQERGKAEIHTV
jgi:hypothetical protein